MLLRRYGISRMSKSELACARFAMLNVSFLCKFQIEMFTSYNTAVNNSTWAMARAGSLCLRRKLEGGRRDIRPGVIDQINIR